MRAERIWYPEASYHVMARGNYRQKIVHDQSDCQVFLELLSTIQKTIDFRLHAFCLMTNHYHLLIETGIDPIWRIMQRLGKNYSSYFNRKYDCIGHLFQSRYKSCLITDDAYFLQVSRYIHLNPVKAQMVAAPVEYKWSSYRTYMGIERLRFISTERGFSYFKGDRVRQYKDFTENVGMQKPMEQIRKDMGENELWLPW